MRRSLNLVSHNVLFFARTIDNWLPEYLSHYSMVSSQWHRRFRILLNLFDKEEKSIFFKEFFGEHNI